MAVKYEPTTKRGADLAEEILSVIEAEEERKNGYDFTTAINKMPVWNQNTWAMVKADALPAGTTIEPLPSDVEIRDYQGVMSHRMATVDSGVSCGTALCFAGHAATLVGDKLVVAVPSFVANDLHKGTKAKNVKRWIGRMRAKARTERDRDYTDWFVADSTTGAVLTVDTNEVRPIRSRAAELLGLTTREADTLFAGGNSLDDLRLYVKRMREGKNVRTGRRK